MTKHYTNDERTHLRAEIFNLRAGTLSHKAIANRLNMTERCVRRVLDGAWDHVTAWTSPAAVVGEQWMRRGACAGQPDDATFFPDGDAATRAKLPCHGCPVRRECLEYALVNDIEEGVWGGLNETQRRKATKFRVSAGQEAA